MKHQILRKESLDSVDFELIKLGLHKSTEDIRAQYLQVLRKPDFWKAQSPHESSSPETEHRKPSKVNLAPASHTTLNPDDNNHNPWLQLVWSWNIYKYKDIRSIQSIQT